MAIGRSENMRRIRSCDTAPELTVRRMLRELGHVGYRLHRRDLPGKPDVAFLGKKKAIFVNGCFWHGHDCTEGRRTPKSNQDYWLPKIEKNRIRDAINVQALQEEGWSVLIIWDCELSDPRAVRRRLAAFLTRR